MNIPCYVKLSMLSSFQQPIFFRNAIKMAKTGELCSGQAKLSRSQHRGIIWQPSTIICSCSTIHSLVLVNPNVEIWDRVKPYQSIPKPSTRAVKIQEHEKKLYECMVAPSGCEVSFTWPPFVRNPLFSWHPKLFECNWVSFTQVIQVCFVKLHFVLQLVWMVFGIIQCCKVLPRMKFCLCTT